MPAARPRDPLFVLMPASPSRFFTLLQHSSFVLVSSQPESGVALYRTCSNPRPRLHGGTHWDAGNTGREVRIVEG